jgi:serine/threonine protein kinase
MSEQLIATPGFFGENENFLLEREIGSGGMGGVYMGRDKMLDRPVAVKVMLKEYGSDELFVEKFKKEAQSAARLIHPNIAQIYSYGICDGMPYISMELVAGGSLFQLMQNSPGKTDIARVMKICEQVAQALRCAADQGLVHGDIKPENVLLDANGNAKIVDFGLAAMQKDTDEIWGTPYYISPEKVKKEPLDFRADMYSLGGTLYHALTGVAPFEGDDPIAVVRKRFEGAPKKPSEIRPEITPAIDALVLKMLSLEKEDRYPSFEALLEAFKNVLTTGLTQQLPTATAVPAAPSAATTTRRGPARMRTRKMITKKTIAAKSGISKVTKDTEADEDKIKSTDDDEDEEGGGNLGAKVFGVIVGVILLIGAVAGGLIWLQVSSRNARIAEERAQIESNYQKQSEALTHNIAAAEKLAPDYEEFAKKASDVCQKITSELSRMLPADEAAKLKPEESDILKKAREELAIAMRTPEEIAAEAAAATNAPAAVAATTNAPAAVVAKPKFRPPTDSESDPASPEGQDYLRQKEEFEKAEAEKAAKAAEATPTPEQPAVEAQPAEKAKPPSTEVLALNDLWNRAYKSMAGAIRIKIEVIKLLKITAEVEALKEQTLANVEKLSEINSKIVEGIESIKASEHAKAAAEGYSYIKSKGESQIRQTTIRLRKEKLEREREEKRKAEEEAERLRKEREAAAKKQKIAEESAAIIETFNKINANGNLRQLDWKSALRQLRAKKAELETVEAGLVADLQIRKVTCMEKMHDVLIKGLKAHKFKGRLAGCKVDKVDEKEIRLIKPDGKSKLKILWQNFIKEYPGNLNEIINAYIIKGRNNPKVKLNLRDWADANLGASLLLLHVCQQVSVKADGADTKGRQMAKEVYKQYPDYQNYIKFMFPEIDFNTSEAEAGEGDKTE